MSRCCGQCRTPWAMCASKQCPCHPLSERKADAIEALRFQQAILRHEAAKAGESPTYIDAFDHADRRRRA